MESIFESSYLFDPTQFEDSTSFLSFSSLAGMSSQFDSGCSWDSLQTTDKIRSNPSSDYTSSPDLSDPFEIVNSAFEPSSPAEYGIFHTPSKVGSTSKIVGLSQVQTYQRSSSEWDSPVTPALTNKSSCDSFSTVATGSDYFLPPPGKAGFAWDEASSQLASSSHSPTPHRVASNPNIGSARHAKAPLNRASMPSLKEEEAATPSQWLVGSETADVSNQQTPYDVNADTLADDLDWVFGEHGIEDFTEVSLFSAFVESDPSSSTAEAQASWESTPAVNITLTNSESNDFSSWLPDLPAPDVSDFAFDPTAAAPLTIDPTIVMNPVSEDQRPLSAPGASEGGMLSVPMGSAMSRRSISSDGYNHPRTGTAPPRDLFAYTPQEVPAGPPGIQPLYTHQPAQHLMSNVPRSMSITSPPMKGRRASQQLNVQINHQSGYSSYISSSPLPPTPQSATFAQSSTYDMSGMESCQPIAMGRAGTQPLPMRVSQATTSRRMSVNTSSLPTPTNMPTHLGHAQVSMVSPMHDGRVESGRQEYGGQASVRRVGMAEASVMQHATHRPQPIIMGWEGPSSQTSSLPILTNAPLMTVLPSQPYYHSSNPHQVHRVHPPPHPSGQTYHPQPQTMYVHPRPMAPLPSPKSQVRRVASSPVKSPTKRSPSKTTRKTSNGPGNFSWGETTFINFTSQDAEKLLTGVAPSGSQSKRRREEDAARMAGEDMGDGGGIEMERSRSKRSRSGD